MENIINRLNIIKEKVKLKENHSNCSNENIREIRFKINEVTL